MKSYVLLISGDPYSARAAVLEGFVPVCVNGPGFFDSGFFDEDPRAIIVKCDDPSNFESVLATLSRASLLTLPYRAILSSDERCVVTASFVGQFLGINSLEPAVAIHFRDKALQKARVSSMGIRAARQFTGDSLSGACEAALHEGVDRVVVKPLAGSGTRDTSVYETARACPDGARSIVGESIVEEFIDGSEWCVDALILDGHMRFASVARYRQPCLSALNSGSPSQLWLVDDRAYDGISRTLSRFMGRAVKALGLSNGVIHGECFVRPGGELVFGECAARPGGALIHEMVQWKYGVDLSRAHLRLLLGRDVDLSVDPRPEVVGETFLIAPPGVLLSAPREEDIAGLPGVEYARVEVPYGSLITPGGASSSNGVGQAMVSASTVPELEQRLQYIADWFYENCECISVA